MKNKKMMYGIFCVVLLCVCIIVIAAGIRKTQKTSQNKGYDLIIPSREEILQNGYPVNENGQTYGPDLSGIIAKTPDLTLRENADGLLGYVYSDPKISSPEEALAYMESIAAAGSHVEPMYLQDGETVIGEYDFGTFEYEVYTNAAE